MKMPAEIANALQIISYETGSLVKDSENKFGNYKYFSHEQLKDKVGKLMAKHGLTMVCNEVDASVKDKYMRCVYDLYLYHSSGADYGPVRRHIIVQANGPQAFGIALSYVQKYFLRDILQLSTGDEDEGHLSPKEVLPDIELVKTPEVDTDQLMDDMVHDLNSCESEQDLQEWLDLYKPQKPLLIQAKQLQVTKLYNQKKSSLKENVDG